MDTSKNLAARAGRWSAHHRKKAILGWLTFVILAVVVGGSFGTKTLGDDDFGIGESGRADKVVSDHFKDKGAESVLIQSRERRHDDRPAVPLGRRRGRGPAQADTRTCRT